LSKPKYTPNQELIDAIKKDNEAMANLHATPSNKQEPIKEGFIWTDELVLEFFIKEYGVFFPDNDRMDVRIKYFKQSKSSSIESKERTEVTKISSTHIDDYDSKEAWIKATLSKHPDANKMRFVRKAIEYVLNQDDKLYKEWLINDYSPSLYTQEQYDKAIEERAIDFFSWERQQHREGNRETYGKTPTQLYQQYLTHLSKIKK
jgi:hypothetical protein